MLNFTCLAAGVYEATAPSGVVYRIVRSGTGHGTTWTVFYPEVSAASSFPTYAAAKTEANRIAAERGDLDAPAAEAPAADVVVDLPDNGHNMPAGEELDPADPLGLNTGEPVDAAAFFDGTPADEATVNGVTLDEAREHFAPVDEPQFTLIPETRPEGRLANVALSRIIRGRVQGAPEELVDSVRSYGVLQPVALVQSGRNEFEIADGRRRVSAAESAELGAVPALIFPEGTPRHVAAAITLTTNMQRRPNPASELEAIQQMVHDGASVDQIAQELRLSTFVIRRRMALANLIPEFRDLLLTEDLAITTAQRVARHPHDEQRQLLETFRATGRITAEDRAARRAARRGAQVDAAPEAPAVLDATAMDEATRRARGIVTLDEITLNDLVHIGENLGVRFVPALEDVDPAIDAEAEAVERVAPAAPEVDLPTGQGWGVVLACLERAEDSLPVAPDDHTDAFFADLNALLGRVRRIVAAA